MAKRKKLGELVKPLNAVAKHAHKFNRCIAFADKTKYSRKGKSSKGFPFDVMELQFFLGNFSPVN